MIVTSRLSQAPPLPGDAEEELGGGVVVGESWSSVLGGGGVTRFFES